MPEFYSVRMRAAKNGSHEDGGKHISGGELLSSYEDLGEAVFSLTKKALTHSRGKPDFMQIQFEAINEPLSKIKPLNVTTNEVESEDHGQKLAKQLLLKSGIEKTVIERAYSEIAKYKNLRGAILIDQQTGERLDHTKEKGIRVSRMDWLAINYEKWADFYTMPKNSRVKEALVLATKVANHPVTVAELCWSDDPEYITGYVASKKIGYQRITKLKKVGDEHGCRVFFVHNQKDLTPYINYLEKQPILIQWEEKNGTRIS